MGVMNPERDLHQVGSNFGIGGVYCRCRILHHTRQITGGQSIRMDDEFADLMIVPVIGTVFSIMNQRGNLNQNETDG